MTDQHRFDAFVAFAGDAKGIVHGRALSALEEQKVRILSAAGTSAGVIIATLAAVGYRADEILNPVTGHSILSEFVAVDRIVRGPVDFFDRGWPFVWRLRTFSWAIAPILLLVALVGATLPLALINLAQADRGGPVVDAAGSMANPVWGAGQTATGGRDDA